MTTNNNTTLVSPTGVPLLREDGKPVGRPTVAEQVLMVPGLSIWKGIISEEYLTDLKPWSKAVKVYKEMEDDVVIGTLYESVKSPLLDAKFTIVPASNSTADTEAADWLRNNTINSQAFDWLDHVDDMLEALSFGFSLSEIILEKVRDGKLWLADLMPVGQETLLRWGDLDKFGRPKSFVQQVVTGGTLPTTREAPMEKLLHFPFRGRKRNPMGRSISRSLYRPWYFAKNLQVVEAIGVERDVGNVPMAELGEGFLADSDYNRLRDALEGLRMDDTAYIIVPNGIKLSPFGSGGKSYNVREVIRDYHHLIRQRFFMDFVSLGSEKVGTQALAKEVTGFFSLALGAVQHQLVNTWNRQLVPYMFKWNMLQFADITGLPKIVWSKPGKINIQSLAQSVTTLLQASAIHWNDDLETHLREVFEIPPISDEDLSAAKEKEEAQMNALTNPQPGPPQTAKGQVPGAGDKESTSAPMN